MSDYAWDVIVNQYRAIYPKLRIYPYEKSRFFSFVKRHYHFDFDATTIYNTIYMRKEMIGTARGARVLHHEVVHVRDMNNHPIIFPLTYWFLPVGPSFKALWEWRAYQADLQLTYDRYKDTLVLLTVLDSHKKILVNIFAGKRYGWMFPFRKLMGRIIQKHIESLVQRKTT